MYMCTQVLLLMHLELPSPDNGDPDRCQDRQTDGRTIRQTGRRAERNDQPSPVATEDQGPKEPGDHGLGPGVGQVQSGRVQAQAQARRKKQQAKLQPSKSWLRV